MTDAPQQPAATGGQPQVPQTSTGLDPHISGLLSYLFGWIGGLVLFLVEKENREVRFHAAQSILLSVGMFAFWIVFTVLSFIPLVGILTFLLSIVLGLAGVALWVYLLVQGYRLNHVRLPIIGAMAESWSGK